MTRLSCAALAALLLVAPAAGAQTLIAGPLTGETLLHPEADYATTKWGDPWDMDRRTDIGFLTWGVEAANIASRTMVGCTNSAPPCSSFRFTANTTNGFAQIFLLDSWQPGSAIVNRVGAARPIDTTRFKYLLLKMKVATGAAPGEVGAVPQFQVSWSRNTIYYDPLRPNSGGLVSLTGAGFGNPGVVMDDDGVESNQYQIYAIRLDQIHWWNPSTHPPTISGLPLGYDLGAVWGSPGVTADSFFLTLPNTGAYAARFGNIDIAWARITTTIQANQTISWNGGSSTYDIVVSPNKDCKDYTVLAEGQSSGFSFDFAALAPGSYFVGLRPTQTDGPNAPQQNIALCSNGSYVVTPAPSLNFNTPTDEGSTDDFATTFLGNAWDLNTLADMDQIHDLPNATIDAAFPAERPDGTPLGNVRVMKGTSITGSDAYVFPLWFNARGIDNRIDANRYRILTYEMGLDARRDINLGSVSRLIWHVSGDAEHGAGGIVTRALENVTDDIVLRHLKQGTESSSFVLDRIQLDMKDRRTFPIETDPDPPAPNEASPSRTGWTNACIQPFCPAAFPPAKPGVDGLRIRFHEFPAPTLTYLRQVKLAALERTGGVYTIAWFGSISARLNAPVVKLYASKQTQSAPTAPLQPANDRELTPSSSCDRQITDGIASIDGSLIPLNGPGGTPFSVGFFAWDVNNVPTSTLPEDSEIYICAVVEATMNGPIAASATMTQFPILVKRSFVAKPRINFDKSTLRFSGVLTPTGTAFASKTPDQTVGITQVGSGTATWRVNSIKDTTGAAVGYVSVTPSSGSGSGTMQVALVAHPSLPRCTAQDGLGVVIELTSDGSTQNEPQYIRAYITIGPATPTGGCVAPSGPPEGQFDTPANNSSGLIGSIAVTGWAMDDMGVQKVEIWRNCVETIDRPAGACTSSAPGQPANFVFIGTAAFLAGARPDIEAAFPLAPQAYRAGWGYLMSTNALPHLPTGAPAGGQGSFTLSAYAVDVEGRYTLLGTKAISIDNDHATIPFGSIDTPDQGGTVTVSPYANFGWAMTQSPKCIPPASLASYRVYIDGVSRTLTPGVNWFTGLTRPDIASAYPGRCNTNNALAAYYIDAAALGISSGLHTIGWDVIDDAPGGTNVAGIGSRFFTLIISSSLQAAGLNPSVGPKLGRPVDLVDGFRLSPGEVVAERQRTGNPLETLASDGGRRTLIAEELERIQFDLPKTGGASAWEGYQLTRNTLGLLPMGSTLDAERGTFYWQPVAGYLGNYDFVFVRRGADGQQERVPVRVTYAPKQWTPGSPSTPSARPSAQ